MSWNNLEWHDFVNPAGMASWMWNRLKNMGSDIGQSINLSGNLNETGYSSATQNLLNTSADQMQFQQDMFNNYVAHNQSNWEQQKQYVQDYNENYYSTLMRSLEKAGINPILAVSNGLNGSALANPASSINYAGSAYGGSNDNQIIGAILGLFSSLISSALKIAG